MAAKANAGIVLPAANNLIITIKICLLHAAPNYISLIKIKKNG